MVESAAGSAFGRPTSRSASRNPANARPHVFDGPSKTWGRAFAGFLDALRDVGRPNALPAADSTMHPGPDQLFSLFARWVFPENGFEAYAEWGRAEFPISMRDY